MAGRMSLIPIAINSCRMPFLISIIAIILTSCINDEKVTLRRFPYPFEAALSICSDIDETGSIEEFTEIQKFLSSSLETEAGTGLQLDIGNSFWFYNDYLEFRALQSSGLDSGAEYRGNSDFGLCLFHNTSDTLTSHASTLLALIRTGHLDCLHSYGHFGENGFSRRLAEQALDLLKSESLAVDVYINHGSVGSNKQNIGFADYHFGDNPESQFYHTDLTIPMGIKFIWQGRLTHCIGQDGDFSFQNLLKKTFECFQTFYHTGRSPYFDNNLVHLYQLDDGSKVFEFVRFINPWGKYSITDQEHLPHQLGPDQIDELIENQGYLIFYTHLGKNEGAPFFGEATAEALRYIRKRFDQGELLVTTTSKLLNYYIHHRDLYWSSNIISDTVFIAIDSISNEVEGCYLPHISDLEGLTFYVPEDCEISLKVGDQPIPFVINKKDSSEKVSITIPWHRLPSPDHIFKSSITNSEATSELVENEKEF